MNLAYESMLNNGQEDEPSNVEGGESSKKGAGESSKKQEGKSISNERGESSKSQEGKSGKNKEEGPRNIRAGDFSFSSLAMIRPRSWVNTKRQLGEGERLQTAFLFNTPHYPPGFTSWAMLSGWKLHIPVPSMTAKKEWEPYLDKNEDFERMQRLFRRVTREVAPRRRRVFAAHRLVPKLKFVSKPRA